MKIIANKNITKYLFWFGPFFLTTGITAGLVSGSWGTTPLIFILAGLALIIAWFFMAGHQQSWWNSRSTQAGTNAIVATTAVLVILGLINFLSTRYHYRADLTETKLFTLAPQTKEIVSGLKEPVKVSVFDTSQNPFDRDLLENYQRQSPNFKFEYIDPIAKPQLVERFGVKNNGEVYIESGDNRKLVQVLTPSDRLLEAKLTSRIQQLFVGEVSKVYFLQGHGERPLSEAQGAMSQAISKLSDKNFTGEPLNLTERLSVPKDTAVVVVAGPKRPLFDAEVVALKNYLDIGGNVMLMIDPNTDPKLDTIYKEWGIKLDNRLAIDIKSGIGLGPAAPIVNDYGQHPITKDFGKGNSLYRLARPIEIIPVSGVNATPLLKTKPYPDSWGESDQTNENLKFDEGKDLKGPLTLGVALTRKVTPKPPASSTPPASPTSLKPSATPTTPNPPTPPTLPPISNESRLVVFGNSDFATDGLFQQQLNGDIFTNSVSWLSQQEGQILSISPKESKNRRIIINPTQANLLAISSLFLLPLLGFVAAAVIWWQRR